MSELDDLDKRVALEVMGWIYQEGTKIFPAKWIMPDDHWLQASTFEPSSDVDQSIAFVIPEMEKRGASCKISKCARQKWWVVFESDTVRSCAVLHERLSEAICRAALLFIEDQEDVDAYL